MTLIRLTSSQPTCDPNADDDDVNRCQDSDQVVAQLAKVNSQLVSALSKLEQENAQMLSANSLLQTSVSQLMTNVSLLHKDLEQMKAARQRLNAKGQARRKQFDIGQENPFPSPSFPFPSPSPPSTPPSP